MQHNLRRAVDADLPNDDLADASDPRISRDRIGHRIVHPHRGQRIHLAQAIAAIGRHVDRQRAAGRPGDTQRRCLSRHGHAPRFPRGLDRAQRALAGPATRRRGPQRKPGRLLQVRPHFRPDADPRDRRLSGRERPIDLGRDDRCLDSPRPGARAGGAGDRCLEEHGFRVGRIRSPETSAGTLTAGAGGHAAASTEGQADLRAGDLRTARP
jgi:hypothetical protein